MMARLMHCEIYNHMRRGKRLAGVKLLCILLLFTAAPHSFAIIRSPYPVKSLPPDRGHMIIIGDEWILVPVKNGR
jgi:hypothetical protein